MTFQWRVLLLLSFISTLFVGSDLAFGSCMKYPRDSDQPVVEVCEHEDSFAFKIGSATRSFLKDDFSKSITQAANNWLLSHNQLESLSLQAPVEVWMSVPTANPEAAQPRAIIQTAFGRVSFWLDLNSMDWHFSDYETGILENSSYPESFGHRPGSVLIQAHSNVPPEDIEKSLLDRGAISVQSNGDGSFEAKTKIFEEKHFAVRAQQIKSMIKYAQVNSVIEWVADRQMAFTFMLARDH